MFIANVYVVDTIAYFGIPTGNTRIVQTANMFSGAGTRTEHEIEAFHLVHPDDVKKEELAAVPDWVSSRKCGIGASAGLKWV